MVKVYYLQYCEHCKELLFLLDKEGISYEKEDADVDIDKMNSLENELETEEYPIVYVSDNSKITYFVSDNHIDDRIGDGVYKKNYMSIKHLVLQIKKELQ